ncbi:uncharacterized protein STEHIDRAFT_166924 [Stereum hirsutum FP-91666 SS1]|uniref:uncharacterized protein n=1 Tax=Stereum hirsutum (strain FP-91666) TaxID=721885 RepID=UPI000440B39E|nr:uncharacterized protein STEHIDRAFT_166924 [Stereum hirsutum FP-91666 SS1]EIM88980.1 hypothetical protein STEHIDRAFT_166924 [Stereum hirsutum FP-91666 SS1]
MATIISSPSSSVYNSKHFLTTSAHDTYPTFHTRPNQQSMPHAHNGFSAFSHGHGYARSSSLASSSTSWRTRAAAPALEPAPAPIPRITPFKRSQKAFTSTSRHRHSASQSSSSDESTASWRSSDASALNHTATHSASVPAATASESAPSSRPGIYSLSELMSLEASPLVGLDPEAQAIVDDFVAHHIYRRPQGRSQRGRRNGNGSGGARRAESGSGRSSPRSSMDADSEGDESH